VGNIRDKSFKEIWEKSETLNWIRNLGKEDFKDCSPCELKQVCPRNSGVAFSNVGDYTAKEPWSCMAAGVIQEKRSELGLE
jgi:radical SAM protein with 4Fe4S-binding SPASM domain